MRFCFHWFVFGKKEKKSSSSNSSWLSNWCKSLVKTRIFVLLSTILAFLVDLCGDGELWRVQQWNLVQGITVTSLLGCQAIFLRHQLPISCNDSLKLSFFPFCFCSFFCWLSDFGDCWVSLTDVCTVTLSANFYRTSCSCILVRGFCSYIPEPWLYLI